MTAYRTSTPACPACHLALEPRSLDGGNVVVDLCKRCGGLWVDWEDGDLTALAREAPPAEGRTIPTNGPGSCPRCHRALTVEVFLDTAEVLRCGECGGAFLPYPSIGKIAASTPADAREDSDEQGVWVRALRTLRGWLNGG